VTEALFDVAVPKSAHCPHWYKGRFVAGHVPIVGTTEKPRRKKPPRLVRNHAVPAGQNCLLEDYECTEPRQKHAIRDGWQGFALYGNQAVHCVRCGNQLYLNKGNGWYCMRPAYRISEVPW
jgi:hypothetical protein